MATRGLWDEPPPPPEPPEERAPNGRDSGQRVPSGPKVLTVAEITRAIRETIRRAPRLDRVWVEGEVGQVTVSSAGHCYFTLKDERAQLRCMIFRDDRLAMPIEPRTGIRIVVRGRVDVFEPQGAYQLYVDTVQPAGVGDLALRFEALKAKLTAEGLFDRERKRPLPDWPRDVGVVTSLSGAVLHDIRRVVGRRWPGTRLLVSPCKVQGAGAAESIVRALRRVGRWTDPGTGRAVDLVIVARGGGALEDLWAFNEEAVVRAVAAHPRPVVVGVGHETDVTLSEFAADVRAATPSQAAELAVPDRSEQLAHVRSLRAALGASASRRMRGTRAELDAERRALETFRPAAYLAAERERIGLLLDRATRALSARLERDRAELVRSGAGLVPLLQARTSGARSELTRSADRLPVLLRSRLARARAELTQSGAGLAALDPFATLERGYAIVRSPDGVVVTDAASQEVGAPLEVRLARGALDVSVDTVRDSEA